MDAGGTGPLLSKFTYAYNAADRIAQWTQQLSGNPQPQRYDLGYDNADQLTAATLTDKDALPARPTTGK